MPQFRYLRRDRLACQHLTAKLTKIILAVGSILRLAGLDIAGPEL